MTPEDFNWAALSALTPPQEEWQGLCVNLTEHPAEGHAAVVDGHELVFLAFLAGMSTRTGISIITTDSSINGNI